MLKAENISAVRLRLSDGVEAVLVQQGQTWNGLREYRCIAPAAFAGQKLLTVSNEDDSVFTRIFSSGWGDMGTQTIMMASPALGAAIQAINQSMASANATQ